MSIDDLLYFSGALALALGLLHFCMPVLLDVRTAISADGVPLEPPRLLGSRYETLRGDVYGISWVMNHVARDVLVTAGPLDLFWTRWLPRSYGPELAFWLAGWWAVRAASQRYLDRRRGDWLIVAGFASLSLLHVAVAL